MTEKIYIKFKVTIATPAARKYNRRILKVIYSILFFIPKANPEFDKLIGDVAEWQLEIDPADHIPVREIGKDINGKTIVIMPWRRNYGYWTDNSITHDYFSDHFNAINIEKEEFEGNWNNFAKS